MYITLCRLEYKKKNRKTKFKYIYIFIYKKKKSSWDFFQLFPQIFIYFVNITKYRNLSNFNFFTNPYIIHYVKTAKYTNTRQNNEVTKQGALFFHYKMERF